MSTGVKHAAPSQSSFCAWGKTFQSLVVIAEAAIWRRSCRLYLFWIVARGEGQEAPVAAAKNVVQAPRVQTEEPAAEISMRCFKMERFETASF